jgi:hypothetical protein
MRALRFIGKWFWRFMIVFSFIVNVVLVGVIIVLLLTIFDIKRNIAQPLLEGLHSSFVGLNDSTIDWTIPVRTSLDVTDKMIQVNDSITLDTDTIVKLTQDVSLVVNANITLPGVGNLNNAQVSLALPKDLELPVHLNLDVPVLIDVPVNLYDIPVDLDVRAVIPLSQTQLHDPVDNLRLLFEPIVRALGNLPDDYSEAGVFASQILSGNAPNLLAETEYSQNPWPGYSITAGQGYDLANVPAPIENLPVQTGIEPIGGIPLLDEGIRPEVYAGDSTPAELNAQAEAILQAQGVAPQYYDGSYSDTVSSPLQQAQALGVQPGQQPAAAAAAGATPVPAQGAPQPTPTPVGDLGIITPPQPGQ